MNDRARVQAEGPKRLVAMYPGVRGKNPYLSQLSDGLIANASEVVDWRQAPPVADRPAFLILNWFENRAVDPPPGRSPWSNRRRRVEREREFHRRLSVVRQRRAAGYRLIWIAHNRRPHRLAPEQSTYDERIAPFWQLVDGVVHLTAASTRDPAFAHLAHLPRAVVPHPHYGTTSAVQQPPRVGPIRRVAFVGGFSARKNALPTIRETLRSTKLEVVVTGSAPNRAARRDLERVGGERLRIVADPVSDDQLRAIFDGTTAAVLTEPNQLNSGVLFFALSCRAPVIVPRTPTNEELVAEFGPQWLRIFDGRNAADDIAALTAEPAPEEPPSMGSRSPSACGRELAAFLDRVG